MEQFLAGLDVELEHGRHDPQTDVTHDDPITTGMIALAHLKEFPDYYYTRLAKNGNGSRKRADGADELLPSITDSESSMDLYDLEPGDRIRLTDGTIAEVISQTEDGRTISVRHIESPHNPSQAGSIQICTEDKIGRVPLD